MLSKHLITSLQMAEELNLSCPEEELLFLDQFVYKRCSHLVVAGVDAPCRYYYKCNPVIEAVKEFFENVKN